MDGRSLLSGMAIGAGLALAFDSGAGSRRRAMLRARLVRASLAASAAVEDAVRGVSQRARAVAAAARNQFSSNEVDDERVLARVRARLGRACAHPDLVEVSVLEGAVTLHGPVLADEVRGLLAVAASVRGVHSVVNDLDAYDTPEDIAVVLDAAGTLEPHASAALAQRRAARALAGVAAVAAGGLALAYSRR
jgi:osmotically-inducible protein OsmY